VVERLALFPDTTQCSPETGRLEIGGQDLVTLAEQYGTPLYLYDQATLEVCAAAYKNALTAHYPGEWGITYAGKAFLCPAIAQWAQQQGFWIDCTGQGELAIAAAAGVQRSQIVVHGINKAPADLQAALQQAGVLVVDNLDELGRIVAMGRDPGGLPAIWLRLRPGEAVATHAYTQTGQADAKFGLSPDEFCTAVRLCLENDLPLVGLHFHQGSHFHDPAPLKTAIEVALDLLLEACQAHGWYPAAFSPGGGWGVPYHESELPHPTVDDYVRFVAENLAKGCRQRSLPLPRLQLEPGRSLVARAGVALYRVGAVKHTPNRRWVILDGGLADNPRPALYGARYSALPVQAPDRPSSGAAWLGGPYCESGDVLIEALPLAEVQPGELVAVPVCGAYQLSMGSNYNGARKPAVVLLQEGRAHLIQRRETLADLLQRDLPLPI